MKKESLESKRFRMVKKRHKKSFEEACEKGKVDALFIPLCEFIAKTKNYFTSSCCSGRILLLGLMGEKKLKKDSYFLFKSHERIDAQHAWNILCGKTEGEIWFKMEPFILHIGTKNLEKAKIVLNAMKNAGIKRGGIAVAKEGKFIIEIIGTQEIATPVKKETQVLISKEYFKELVNSANEKLERNEKQLKRLEVELKKVLE